MWTDIIDIVARWVLGRMSHEIERKTKRGTNPVWKLEGGGQDIGTDLYDV